MSKKQIISVSISERLKQRILDKAKKEKRSLSNLISIIVEDYLKKEHD